MMIERWLQIQNPAQAQTGAIAEDIYPSNFLTTVLTADWNIQPDLNLSGLLLDPGSSYFPEGTLLLYWFHKLVSYDFMPQQCFIV